MPLLLPPLWLGDNLWQRANLIKGQLLIGSIRIPN